jgi:hypothetical protein
MWNQDHCWFGWNSQKTRRFVGSNQKPFELFPIEFVTVCRFCGRKFHIFCRKAGKMDQTTNWWIKLIVVDPFAWRFPHLMGSILSRFCHWVSERTESVCVWRLFLFSRTVCHWLIASTEEADWFVSDDTLVVAKDSRVPSNASVREMKALSLIAGWSVDHRQLSDHWLSSPSNCIQTRENMNLRSAIARNRLPYVLLKTVCKPNGIVRSRTICRPMRLPNFRPDGKRKLRTGIDPFSANYPDIHMNLYRTVDKPLIITF